MNMLAEKGSRLVKLHREEVERKKASKKEWELAGSKLGNLLGIQKENDKEERDADDQLDHRDNQKFADHMKVRWLLARSHTHVRTLAKDTFTEGGVFCFVNIHWYLVCTVEYVIIIIISFIGCHILFPTISL